MKPKPISTFMTLQVLEVKVESQSHFMGLVMLEKASNVARDLFSDNDYAQNHQR